LAVGPRDFGCGVVWIRATLFSIMGVTKSNLPQNVPLRWNIEKASIEFAVSMMTLRKALAKNDAEPDAAGLYTSRQIASAVYGGAFSEEKLRTQRQLTKKLELENSITEATVLSRSELMKGLATIADAVSSRIMSAELPRSVKEDLLKDIASIPLVLKEVAHGQSRLPRRNGAHSEEVTSESQKQD
jgi:hypothetical protein